MSFFACNISFCLGTITFDANNATQKVEREREKKEIEVVK